MVPTASSGQALVVAVVVANGAEAADEFTEHKAVGGARRSRSAGGGGDHGAESGVEMVVYRLLLVVEIVVMREVGEGV